MVADAAIVLCGGVLCGGVSCCGLLEGLARDGVLPKGVFGKRWERTGAEWVSVGVYLGLCVCESFGRGEAKRKGRREGRKGTDAPELS